MSAGWLTVAGAGVVTVLLKATGPVLMGGRVLGERTGAVVELLGPSLLGALVVTQAVGGDRSIVVDERLVGLVAAGVAIRLRAPLLAVVVAAAVATAAVRAVR